MTFFIGAMAWAALLTLAGSLVAAGGFWLWRKVEGWWIGRAIRKAHPEIRS